MKKLPKILVIGRQNVGKSTLFNKIIKKRHAIVNDTPGLTRDYMDEPVQINGYYYELIDTGGLTDNKEKIEIKVKEQVMKLFKEARLILFMVEKKGLVGFDYEITDLIRKANKKTVLVINKVDNPLDIDKPELLSEFYELGFKTIIPVSAEHRINFDTLFDAINDMIPAKIESLDDVEDIIKIAILGKPNVGKSSIINCLANSERVIVTEIPGTTRDSIDVEIKYNNQKFTFIDTAGIRKKSKIATDIEFYSINRAVKSIKRADMIMMVLSAEDLLTDPDKKIFQIINNEKKPCLIGVNKWDLIDKTEENIHNIMIKKIRGKLPMVAYMPINFISAKTGHNIPKLLPAMLSIYNNFQQRLKTSSFNDFVQKTVNRNSPPQEGGFIKIFYGTHVSTAPPVFIFFTNKPDKIKENYKNYLINRIRDNYDFSGCPILLKFRKK